MSSNSLSLSLSYKIIYPRLTNTYFHLSSNFYVFFFFFFRFFVYFLLLCIIWNRDYNWIEQQHTQTDTREGGETTTTQTNKQTNKNKMMMSNAYFNSTSIDSSKNLANSGNNASSGNLSAMTGGVASGGGGGGSTNQLSSFFSNNSSNPNLANSKFKSFHDILRNKKCNFFSNSKI